MDIRLLSETFEFEETLEIQREVWGWDDVDLVPPHLIRAVSEKKDRWGIILGAFDSTKMVGLTFCFPTLNPDVYLMHMIAVLPEFQHRGIGYALMSELKSIATDRKVKKIVWTYDPLESVNATLYFRKMNAICREYTEAYYVFHGSQANYDFPEDRFKMELFTDDVDRNSFSLRSGDSRIEITIPLNFHQPGNQNIDEAVYWRNKTRSLFRKYINEERYWVIDFEFIEGEGVGRYVLIKRA